MTLIITIRLLKVGIHVFTVTYRCLYVVLRGWEFILTTHARSEPPPAGLDRANFLKMYVRYLSYRYKGLRGGEFILTTHARSEAPPAGCEGTNSLN
jgi:hypothetical protein